MNTKETNKKKPYTKPELKTETLTIYGAVCNGTTNGYRKSSAGSPNFCNTNRLNS
jgi:hypothetical protein